jgi:hypothetical protein
MVPVWLPNREIVPARVSTQRSVQRDTVRLVLDVMGFILFFPVVLDVFRMPFTCFFIVAQGYPGKSPGPQGVIIFIF